MTDASELPNFKRVSYSDEPRITTYRMQVPGGWIYFLDPSHREPSTVFVPDPTPRGAAK